MVDDPARYPSPRFNAMRAAALQLDTPLAIGALPVADEFSAAEGAYDNGVLTQRLARVADRAYAAYKGRTALRGGTGAGQTLQGGGAAEWFGPGGKFLTSSESYFLAVAAEVADRLYVHADRNPGGAVRVMVTLDDVDTGLTLTLGATQKDGSTRKYPLRIAPGQRIGVRVETTAGVIANAIRLSFAIGLIAAQTDAAFFGCLPAAAKPVTLNKPAGSTLYTEVPYWYLTVPQLTDRAFLASTSYTNLCRTTQAGNLEEITITSAQMITAPEAGMLWARSYNGAYSAATLNQSTPQQVIVMGMHGENKNERFVDAQGHQTYLQNTVAPLVLAEEHSSGYNPDGTYTDDYEAYFAFVSIRWMASTAAVGWVNGPLVDIGPVAWPQAGYLKPNGTAASNGVGQGTLFAAPNGYLYCYYRDSSVGSDGMKVVRAPIAADAWKNPLNWKIYYRVSDDPTDAANWAKPSLPDGFTKATANLFLGTPGNPGTPVSQHHTYAGRLAVARVRDSNPPEYRAIEEYSYDGGIWNIRLLKTTDLVNFTILGILQQGAAADADFLNYPILMDVFGSDHAVVDPNAFLVLGAAFYTAITQKQLVSGAAFVTP